MEINFCFKKQNKFFLANYPPDGYRNHGSDLLTNSTIMLGDKKQSAKVAVIHEWSYLMLEIENRPNMEVNYEYLLYLESK